MPIFGELQAAEQDVFEFDGAAGDVVWLSIVETVQIDAGFAPQVTLLRPNGAVLRVVYWSGAETVTLPDAGRYTLRVDDVGGDRGSYQLRLEWIAPMARQCTAQSIACGTPVTGALETNDQDLRTFDAAAGDVVWLSIVETVQIDAGFAPQVTLFRPNGAVLRVVYWSGAETVTLPDAGRYTLRVDDVGGDRGSYQLRLEWIAPTARQCTAQSIACGTPLTGALETNDQDLRTFDAAAGDVVWLSLVETVQIDAGFAPQATLFRPNGAVLRVAYWSGAETVTLPDAGRYTLRVDDVGGDRGSYQLRLEWIAPTARQCTAQSIACGTPLTGALETNDQDLRTFDAVAGDVVWLSLVETVQIDAGFAPQVTLFRPNGAVLQVVYASDAETVTLPDAGRYTLRVDDVGGDRGSYQLRLEWIAPTARQCTAQHLGCRAEPVTAPLDINDQNVWTFDGVQGTSVLLSIQELLETDPGFNPQAAVYRPDGSIQANVYTTSAVTLSIGQTGRYTVRVFDVGGDRGSYRLSVQTPCPVLAAPTGLIATPVSASQIDLAWAESAADETSVRVERSSNGTDWAEIATLAANSTAYSSTGLSCDTPYQYRVRVYRAADNQFSSYSSSAAGTTLECREPGDDYPDRIGSYLLRDADWPNPTELGGEVDPWAFWSRNCTSFVAWRMNQVGIPFHNYMTGVGDDRLGDAARWANRLESIGWSVSNIPLVGAIAHWGSDEGVGPNGHVAHVVAVNEDGTVTLEEYNWNTEGTFTRRLGRRAPRYIIHRRLLRSAATSELFWLQAGRRFGAVPEAVLTAMEDAGLSGWSRSAILTATSLPGIPAPAFIGTASSSNGLVVRRTGDIDVDLTWNGRRRRFDSPEALNWGGVNWFPNVIEVAPAIMSAPYTGDPGAPIFEIGQGEPNAAIKQSFMDAYARLVSSSTDTCEPATSMGWPGTYASCLEFPQGLVQTASSGVSGVTGRYQLFGNETLVIGALEQSVHGTFGVWGAIYAAWAGAGYSGGVCGFPTSDEFHWGALRRSNFEGGYIYWDPGNPSSATVVCGLPPFSKISPANGETGQPTSLTLSWGASSGATSYRYCVDTTNNGACDTTWTGVGVNLSAAVSGLNGGTTYYWQVEAQNAGGTTPANSGTWWNFTTQVAGPGAFAKTAPANGASGQSTSLTLAWSASSSATSYRYCVDTTNNGTCDTPWTGAGANLSAALSGLSAGTTYYWQVEAQNTGGTTPANSGTWWGFTTQAAGPGAFAKTAPANGATGQSTSLTLNWGASSGATSYRYCVDTTNNSTCDTTWTGAGVNLSAAVSGLNAGTTYYWQVEAQNAGGTTPANSGMWWSLTTQVAGPGAFAKTAPANGATGHATSLTLSWGASSGATSYRYCVDTTNNSACDTTWTGVGVNLSAAVSGLNAGTTYYWQVEAQNAGGTTPANSGAWWSLTTQMAGPGAFAKTAPADGATGQGTSLTLSWSASSSATSYRYCVDTTNNGTCDTTWTGVGVNLSAAVSGLNTGTTYYWQVEAQNAGGTTPANSGTWWSFTTAAAPTAVNDQYSTTSNTTLTIPAPGVLGNDQSNGAGIMSAALVQSTSNGSLVFNANGGFTYQPNEAFAGTDTFTYQAVSSAGSGNVAPVSIVVISPSTVQPPTDLVATSIAGNEVTLRWNPPLSGPDPSGYVLEGGLRPGEVLDGIATNTNIPLFTFAAPTGAFYVRMHSLSGGERSAPSNEIRVFVNTPSAPSLPANLLGLVNGSTLGLAWRNTYEGGAPTSLVLDVTGSATLSLPLGLAESFSFAGVPGGTYTLSVRAVNASGSSPPSNPVTLTFPGMCSGPPLAPGNFLAYSEGQTVRVTWNTAATGPSPTAFEVDVSGAYVGRMSTTGHSLSGFVAPGSYRLRARGVNACGAGPFTALQTVLVPSGQPLVVNTELRIELFNVDDVLSARLNGITVAEGRYGMQVSENLTGLLVPGTNTIELQLENGVYGGWSYGYRIWVDGALWVEETCGQAGTVGCNNNDSRLGVVHRRSFLIRRD